MLDFEECDSARIGRNPAYDGRFFTGVRAQPASTAGRSAQRVVRRARMSNITRQPPPLRSPGIDRVCAAGPKPRRSRRPGKGL